MKLLLPARFWSRALVVLRERPNRRERVAYFDGAELLDEQGETVGVVTTLTVPHARSRAGFFDVSADDMSEAGRHFRPHGLVRLAQIHSHPGSWVGHSEVDDSQAYSQRQGAISIVVPNYALTAPGFMECGVHLRGTDAWVELNDEQKRSLIRVVPDEIDLRR